MNDHGSLSGRRILVVEDEYLLASDIANSLRSLGAAVIGPAPSVAAALALIKCDEAVDGAVLDVNLRGEMVYPLADWLVDRGVPLMFLTAYDPDLLPERFRLLPRCTKPLRVAQLQELLAQIIEAACAVADG